MHPDGALWWRHTPTAAGDHVELLAQVDLLAIVNPCANDIFGLRRFDVRPVRVAIRPSSGAERERWERPAPAPRAADLRPLPATEPSFDLSGLERVDVAVRLDAEAARQVARLRTSGTLGATTDGEVAARGVLPLVGDHGGSQRALRTRGMSATLANVGCDIANRGADARPSRTAR